MRLARPISDTPAAIRQREWRSRGVARAPLPQLWWYDQAMCKGASSSVMAPTRGESVAEALALCSTCPVLVPCRKYALATPGLIGVWGGTTGRDRRRLSPSHIG